MKHSNVLDPNLVFVTKRTYSLNCNWKVFVDNFLDGGYHVSVAHPELTEGIYMGSYQTEVEGTVTKQTVTEKSNSNINSVTKNPMSTELTQDGWIPTDELLTQENTKSSSYFFVYPNFMLNRYGAWLDTNLVTPTGPTSCTVTFEYFVEKSKSNDVNFIIESLAASDLVQQQDVELCEKVQRGMASHGYEPGRYVAVEHAMYGFHRGVWENMTDDV